MTLFLAALAASYLVVLLIGLLGGLYLDHRPRRVPEHPVLRPLTSTRNPNRNSYTVRLRLVEPPPFDQDREMRGGA